MDYTIHKFEGCSLKFSNPDVSRSIFPPWMESIPASVRTERGCSASNSRNLYNELATDGAQIVRYYSQAFIYINQGSFVASVNIFSLLFPLLIFYFNHGFS
ncbi:hypothetical protein NE237_019665 [Protea cynaroides]|uniref:Uncharacterized protein n=1 Tax=Protea cynaroides TaxID=273540 RepID=A0A9Q0H7Y5_9MAGN|nr:hypothetical protein NE237_019665 [Protea cynaroides]